MSKETILVTGGAGYIGSHTIVSLINLTDYEIVSADNYSNSSAATYDRIERITGKRIAFLEVDLSKKEDTEKVFAQFPDITGVIHFAAYKSVPESVAHPEMYFRNNLDSLKNVIETGRKHKLRNVIFSSSCSVYGNIDRLPVSESTPFSKAESPYAETKILGENMMKETFSGSADMKGISLRYFNPVGAHETGLLGELPNQRPNNLVPVITQTAIGKIPSMSVFGSDYPTRDGTCVRDYIHVCDIAEAHVLAMKRLINDPSAPSYDVFNLGSGNGVTVLEAIHAFEKVSGKKLNYVLTDRRAGDVTAIYSDSAKAKNELGWSADRSLDEMMASAWKWEQHLASKQS
jgi:UDP-glucose 4-epimerase